jgi:anti-anti-sigma regulatory factor
MVKKINIKKDINIDLSMRFLAEDIFEIIGKNEKEVIIDFDEIEFMSRSFAQEYVYQKEQIPQTNIIEINMSENVKKMFQVVYDRLEKLNL